MWRSAIAEHGFATIPAVLTAREIDLLIAELSQPGLKRNRAGIRHALAVSPFAKLARDERLLSVAREILGAGVFPFHATLFEKSSAANWLVAWHQDTALPLRERRETPGWGPWSVKDGVIYAHAPAAVLEQVLALRVHLDDSTSENGPLRVLPGTHKLGVISDDDIHKVAGETTAVNCLVPRGGVLAMRPLLIHASSKSQGTKPRRVLHIEYAAPVLENGLDLAAN